MNDENFQSSKEEENIWYLYRNAEKFIDKIKKLPSLGPMDCSVGILCYDIIERSVIEELDENDIDKELEFLWSKNKIEETKSDFPQQKIDQNIFLNDENKSHVSIENNEILQNNAEESKEISSPDIILHSSKDEKIAEKPGIHYYKEKSSRSLNFYTSNLGILLKPLIQLCNKPIVDLIFYVYRKTGRNHFDFLFDEFTNFPDVLIELHLLISRVMKSNSFDLRDIKSCLETLESGSESIQHSINISGFSNSVSSPTLSHKDLNENIDLGACPDSQESISHQDARPFKDEQFNSVFHHLSQAKSLLMNLPRKDTKFFIDNAATFLSLKFDREIFLSFKANSSNPAFIINLNKFENMSLSTIE